MAGLAAGLILHGCIFSAAGHAGDFGRPQRLLLFSGPAVNWPSDPPLHGGSSSLPLTHAEVEMRDAAYSLRVQVQNLGVMGGYPFLVASYADHLLREGYLYGPARLARIDHEMQADHDAVGRFGLAARIVLIADGERRRTFRERPTAYSPADRERAHARIDENRAFVEGTFVDLQVRFAAYGQAIDRTRIETPAVATGDVETSLVHLQQRTYSLRYELANLHGVEAVPGVKTYSIMQKGRDAPHDLRPPERRALK